MPRAQFNGAEVDGNLKIEDGVRATLRANSIAQVPTRAIETDYDLYDEQIPPQQCSVEEKCREIVGAVKADSFEVKGDEVWFRRKPRA
jgi:hypothetical protein